MKNNVIDFKQFDKDDKKVIKVGNKTEKKQPSAEDIARQEAIEKQIIKLNKRYRSLSKGLKQADSDQQANIKILKYCLKSTVNLLPMAEEIYVRYKNERAAYAYNSLTSQARELLSDIRQLSTNEKTVEYLLQTIMLPALQLVLQQIISSFADLKNEFVDSLPDKKKKILRRRMDKLMLDQGKLLTDVSKSVEVKIRDYFK